MSRGGRRARHVAVAVLVLAATIALGLWAAGRVGEALSGSGPAHPVLVGGAALLASSLLAPASIVGASVGWLLGPWIGIPVALLAETLGGLLAMLGTRRLASARIRRLLAGRPRWRAFVEAVRHGGWPIVLLLRLGFLVPFNATHVICGAAGVRAAPFALASLVGLVPCTSFWVLLGAAGGAAATGDESLPLPLLVVGLASTAALSVLLARDAARRLAAARGGERP